MNKFSKTINKTIKLGLMVFSLVMIVGFANVSYADRGDNERDNRGDDSDNSRPSLCERGGWWSRSKPCQDNQGNKPPLVYIFATKYSIKSGGTTELYWDAKRADSCSASGGWSGAQDVKDQVPVSPTATTLYTITCTNAFGSYTDSVEIYVKPPKNGTTTPPTIPAPTLTFTGSPLKISDDSSSTLTWSSSNTNYCLASNGWSGSKSLSGSQAVEPNATTTYTLACGGAGGTTTKSVEIAVYPASGGEQPAAPTLSFTTASSTLLQGATTTLNWTSGNTNYCLASNGWSGSQSLSSSTVVSPTVNTTYTLSCGGLGGTTTQSTTINVVTPSAPASTALKLSEVNYLTATLGEWVEIYNGTGAPVTMDGWTISDAASSDVIATTTIPNGGFILITGSTTLATSLPGVTVVTLANTTIGGGLNDTGGDAVFLRDQNGAVVDSMSYGTNATGFTSGSGVGLSGVATFKRTSLVVDTDTSADWATSTPATPGS